jgi:hypothetical protein
LSMVVSAAVVVDALGSFSPLSAQARGGAAPEAAMLLVGSCVDMPTPPTPTAPPPAAAATGATPAAAAAPCDMLWGRSPIDKWVAARMLYVLELTVSCGHQACGQQQQQWW